MPEDHAADRDWLERQVADYERVKHRYDALAGAFERLLCHVAAQFAPTAIVQTRAKSVTSFGEKALRKREAYEHPVEQFPDLCGARVIVRSLVEVEALRKWIEANFDVDPAQTDDPGARLAPAEFGYRSLHFLVLLPPKHPESLPPDLCAALGDLHDLKIELQLRTVAQHAFADFAHDLSYKGAFEPPERLRRQLSVTAAQLEDVDGAFATIQAGLAHYASSYGEYVPEAKRPLELARLQLIREHAPDDVDLAHRVGRLARALQLWDVAIEALSRHVDPDHPERAAQPVLRDLGVALTKHHSKARDSTEFLDGRRYLELAGQAPAHDPAARDADALASLAGTWKGEDDQKAKHLYLEAFEADPTNAYPLGNYIEYLIAESGSLAPLDVLRPAMRSAIERRRNQAQLGLDLPWPYYDIGKFSLLLGEPHEALDAYAKAAQTSAVWEITTSLEGLTGKVAQVQPPVVGLEWARRMLLLGLATKAPPDDEAREQVDAAREELAGLALTGEYGPVGPAPVVILVGGTDERVQQEMAKYRGLLCDAFAGFAGTVISGGTEQGVSGLAGDIGAASAAVHTIGYLPSGEELPPDATVDRRYDELRVTGRAAFSPLEPLQNWIDLLASGIAPAEVAVLGINGGQIAALEYRIALSLGARVGVLEGSGREATKLLASDRWGSAKSLRSLPPDNSVAVVDFLRG